MANGATTTAGKTASKAAGAAAGRAGKQSFSAWYAGHKPEALLGAGGIVVAIALYVKSRNAAAASSSGTNAPASQVISPGTLAPYTGSPGGSSDMSGIDSILAGLGNQLSQIQGQLPAPGTPGTPAAAAPAASTPPAPTPTQYGYGEVPTSLGEMVWLGVTGAGGSTGADYQVGGGAPVYFGNASSLAQGGTTQAGVDVYVPVAYAPQVSAKPGGG